jgi:hypothetical protein
VGASAACWAIFAAWSGGAGQAPAVGGARQLVLDAYMVQHPGIPEPRAIRSVGIHLMSMCLRLERGARAADAPRMIQRILARPPAFRWLEPPVPNGTVTIADVADAASGVRAAIVAVDFGRGVWEAWSPYHATVRGWLDASLGHLG